jgi:hypothetical protein
MMTTENKPTYTYFEEVLKKTKLLNIDSWSGRIDLITSWKQLEPKTIRMIDYRSRIMLTVSLYSMK